MDDIIPDLRRARVLGFEMESSLLFVLSSLFGLRSGAIMAVFANRVTGQVSISGESECAKVACEAVKILYEKGTLKKA
jgi:uridine phosphorylase